MAEVKRITEPQLADVLKGFRLAVRTEDGGLVNGEIHVPDNVALHVFRSVSAVREDEPGSRHATGPRAEDADLCARCGNQFKPGQVCDSCREIAAGPWAEPPDVHVHCEHAPASRAAYELEQADRIVEMLGRLPQRHVKRVLRWAWDYLTDGDEPPF